MSGLDPLAAFALQAVANAQASLEEAAINLGALVEDFRAQLSVGDVLSATVLPPQNGSDRLLFLGQTIAAQLPPGINPGETLALQVTGFTKTAILVRNLGVVDEPPAAPESPSPASNGSASAPASQPSGPPPGPPASPELPPVVAQAPQHAILTGPRSANGAPNGPEAAPATPNSVSRPADGTPPGTRPVAPPRELFVAASVRPHGNARPAGTPPPQGARTAPEAAAAQRADDIEARIAATRARLGTPPPPVKAPAPSTSGAPARVARLPLPAPGAAPSPPASARPTPEAALLGRLRVPITPTTLGAARIVDTATRSLTAAFEKLDAILAKLPPGESTSSLRSSLAFVARFDLRNVRALPEQIGSYLSNVVSGAESKVAQIVRAWSEGVAENLAPPAAEQNAPPSNVAAQRAAPATTSEPAPPAISQTPVPAIVAARAAERDVALAHDVKSALLQLVASPPSGSSPQVVAALRDALTATTAVQLNVLQAQTADPNVITIPLPAYFHDGGAPAQLRVTRDAPRGKQKMDADNFHIAFVLDTASLGTVAIDLTTVGRSVSVDVKTEAPHFADRFRSTLPDLRSRLEQLQYRVASIGAATAMRGTHAASPASAPEKAVNDRNVDLRA